MRPRPEDGESGPRVGLPSPSDGDALLLRESYKRWIITFVGRSWRKASLTLPVMTIHRVVAK